MFFERFAHFSEQASRSNSITQHSSANAQESERPNSSDTQVDEANEAAWVAAVCKDPRDEYPPHLRDNEDEDEDIPWGQVVDAGKSKGTILRLFYGDPNPDFPVRA